tara:strand:+ start:1908 stop:2450 length:543 start_codon:yes stop_codon:yes gene_type:complete
MSTIKNIAVLASGNGTNFQAIIDKGIIVNKVLTNNPKAGIIERAKNSGHEVIVVKPLNDERLNYHLEGTDLIVLAGWMRILSTEFCKQWEGKIINIHPSLLPAFKGSIHAIEDAFNYGCKVFGATVHWVTPDVDGGEIIDQRAITINNESLEVVEDMVHRYIEHIMYPQTIKQLIKNGNI